MTQFDDRGKASESRFAHAAEFKFKAMARRNRLLGLWAAEMMGYDAKEAGAYAKEVVHADFIETGDEDVFRKLRDDLKKNHIDISDHRIRKAMDLFFEEAVQQLETEA